MESGDPPSLYLARPFIKEFFEAATPEERLALWTIFFSLLLDPNPDNVTKFEMDVFPYTGQGVREYYDREFMVAYYEGPQHDVHVLRIFRQRRLREMEQNLGLP